jgi:hypothetical protein
MSNNQEKPKNKTLVYNTDTNSRVKGVIVSKTDHQLVVDLPTGFQMTLVRSNNRRPYSWRVGTMEFISDGWEQV